MMICPICDDWDIGEPPWENWETCPNCDWNLNNAKWATERIAQLEAEVGKWTKIANEEHAQSAHIAMRNGELEANLLESTSISVRLGIKLEKLRKMYKDQTGWDDFELDEALAGE